ncbi:monovalent cation/H+ antiporter complex subunit F [Raineyella sp. W15-4]|uniref:monovalent cation/H+ antiporter complex subunit F n=1 Tax=Raineyella sp. W15-4 TaxID=3081651 RepID=UPI00295380A6|nr:monovalent cation/H+ antiporter complex subunit F [Raineyella sp. W15-4]WOQ18255.1 monovalent cation/H+ antiporter complex subunit F [Raineyella sp. W15-4]
MTAVDSIEAAQGLVAIVAVVVLGLAAAVTLFRLAKGPTSLDRIIASDLIVGIAVGGLALQVVLSDRLTTLPILLALSLVGFIGAVSMARFVHDQVPGSAGEVGRRSRRRGEGRRPTVRAERSASTPEPMPGAGGPGMPGPGAADPEAADPGATGRNRSGGTA